MGANGAGNSSLLNAVSGRVLPRQGTVRFNGEDVTRVPTYQRAAVRPSVRVAVP